MFMSRFRRLHIALLAATFLLLGVIVPVLAQQGTTISLGAVDSRAFPQVQVTLFVTDALGSPVANLTAADFQVFEDGVKVPAASIAVERDDSQPMSLVLAVDISTEAADLERIRDGLLALVNGLKPGDQVLLLSFFDEVRVEQETTSDLDAVRAAIGRLSVTGSFTALNRAAVESLNRAALFSNPRSAVVIVTDSVENFDSLSAEGVASRAGEGNLPVYLIAFSPKVQAPGAIDQFAQQIKAQPFIVGTATEAQLRLQTLTTLLSRGYQLNYISSLPADSADHTLSINLASSGATGRADALLRALPGEVSVSFPEVSNGQQVGGLLSLTPRIQTPGAVVSAEYTLDGQRLAVVEDAPFTLDWESSTATPGSHVIGVRVQDQAGNTGEHYLTVQVVDPLTVAVSTTQERLFVGDQITVVANVESLNGVGTVDFFLNNVLLGSVNAPPYQITFDSSDYDVGAHVFAVEVADTTGFSERAEFAMDLAPTPPRFLLPTDLWLRLLALGSILLAIFLAWLMLTYAGTAGRRQRRARFRLALQNEGNMASTYLLRADDPLGRLDFQFFHNGMVLRGRQVIEWVDTGRRQTPEQPRSLPRPPAAQLPAPPPSAQTATAGAVQAQPAAGKGGGFNLGQLTQKTGQFGQVMGVVWGLLGALSRFLPQSMGGDLATAAARQTGQVYANTKRLENVNQHAQAATRLAQGQSRSAAQTPDQYRAQGGSMAQSQAAVPQMAAVLPTEQLAAQAAGFQPAMPAMVAAPPAEASSFAPPAPASWPHTNGGTNGAYTNGHSATVPAMVGSAGSRTGAGQFSADGNLRYDDDGKVYKKVVRRMVDSNWTETPEVEAGDTLQLELVVEPRHARRTRTYDFRISSKAMAEPGTPLHVEESTAKIRGISFLNWLVVPVLVTLTAAAIVLFMVYYLLVDFGLISALHLSWPLF